MNAACNSMQSIGLHVFVSYPTCRTTDQPCELPQLYADWSIHNQWEKTLAAYSQSENSVGVAMELCRPVLDVIRASSFCQSIIHESLPLCANVDRFGQMDVKTSTSAACNISLIFQISNNLSLTHQIVNHLPHILFSENILNVRKINIISTNYI